MDRYKGLLTAWACAIPSTILTAKQAGDSIPQFLYIEFQPFVLMLKLQKKENYFYRAILPMLIPVIPYFSMVIAINK